MSPPTPRALPRRAVLAGLAALGAALAGCADEPVQAATPEAVPDGSPSATTSPRAQTRQSTRAPDHPERARTTSEPESPSEDPPVSGEPTRTPEPERGDSPPTREEDVRGGEQDGPEQSPTEEPTSSPAPPLLTTDAVPVGGGVVLASRSLVVTQPEAGVFRGFDTHCTHRGCPVDRVADGAIHCPCHSSQFSVADGSPVTGPAQRPLEGRRLTVRGGGIYLD